MSTEYLTNDTDLKSVADAIRAKTGKTDPLTFPAEFASEIAGIETGGGSDLSLGLIGATVGQIAKITAVDENGVPTAWEPVNMPSGGWKWTQHTDMTVEEDVSYVQIDDLPEDWKELYILIEAGSKFVYRKITDDSEQNYVVMAGKAANWRADTSSMYIYSGKGQRWGHVVRPDDKHFCAVSSRYVSTGNSGFNATASAAKTSKLELVDPTSVTIFGWGITADYVVSAGTKVKIWHLM